MFQLIVTVISIALVAALSIASIFYGGSAFSGSSAKTAATTLINGGQQIAGATALFRTDNGGNNPAAATINESHALISTGDMPQYLQAAPTPPNGVSGTWATTANYAVITVGTGAPADLGLCARVEADNGTSTGNTTSTDVNSIDLPAGVPFACVGVGGETVFAYKL